MHVERLPSGLSVEVRGPDDMQQLGRHLAELIGPGCVIGLIGPLGAGKTYLARSIAESLGVPATDISSPTYVLINEYEGQIPIYHFDTYRLDSREAFDDLGASEYFEGSGVCLVEWADRVMDRLPAGSWIIRLVPGEGEDRRIDLDLPDPIATRLASNFEPEDRREPHG